MIQLEPTVEGVSIDRSAAAPTLIVTVVLVSDVPVHSIMLRTRIVIAARSRPYSDAEQGRLVELFGRPEQWDDFLTSVQFADVSVAVRGFEHEQRVELRVPCTSDIDVAAAKYFHHVDEASVVPLELLFSGTAFVRSGTATLSVEQLSHDLSARWRMPASIWHELMALHFGRTRNVRLSTERFDALAAHRAARSLPSWDATVDDLLGRNETPPDRFAPAAAVADAVVYEGYILYPYRATSAKNRCRWTFGLLVPPSYAAAHPDERSAARTEVVAAAAPDATVHVRVRMLRVQQRLDEGAPDGPGSSWDEAVEAVVDLPPLAIPTSGRTRCELPIDLAASRERDDDPAGIATVRVLARVRGAVVAETEWVDERRRLLRVSVTVENADEWADVSASRDSMTRHALASVHTMLAIDGGRFVSSMDPPADAREAVASCTNVGMFPVLVGDATRSDLVLSSPIILYDHPQIAPESKGDLYDSTEIDEILALRVLTLTADEKAAARALDPRAAAIVDRCEEMTPESWSSLHGTIRSITPITPITPVSPITPVTLVTPTTSTTPVAQVADGGVTDSPGADTIEIGGVPIGPGAKVVLRPSRRADAQDAFVAGRAATVAGVFHDVNGVDVLVGVTVDDDPATEMLLWHGRYLYFHPDELEPVTSGAPR